MDYKFLLKAKIVEVDIRTTEKGEFAILTLYQSSPKCFVIANAWNKDTVELLKTEVVKAGDTIDSTVSVRQGNNRINVTVLDIK